MKRITYEMLKARDCGWDYGLDAFRELWPKGMPVTIRDMTITAAHEYKEGENIDIEIAFYLLCDDVQAKLENTAVRPLGYVDARDPKRCANFSEDLAQLCAALQAAPEPTQ